MYDSHTESQLKTCSDTYLGSVIPVRFVEDIIH